MPDQLVSVHKMYEAIIAMSGDVHSVCSNIPAFSNRLTSFDSKLANFPGAVSLRAPCDS